MKTLNTLLTAALLTITGITHASTPQLVWELEGFAEPESVLADKQKPVIYVTNMDGHPLEADGKGYVSLVSKDGEFIQEKWITGMDAPKGMATFKNLLYVADLKQLHIIDHEKGELLQSIKIHHSTLLNDIAIDKKGTVYVSDFIGGGIYRLKDNQITQWISAETLPHPNGLYFHKGKLLVATWGEGMQADFTTKKLGSLYTIKPNNAEITLLKGTENIGNLDGIGIVGKTIYVNDWINGNVFTYKKGKTDLVMNAGKNAADISTQDKQLYVPMMFSKSIKTYSLD